MVQGTGLHQEDEPLGETPQIQAVSQRSDQEGPSSAYLEIFLSPIWPAGSGT